MAEDGGHLSGVPEARGSEGRSSLPRTFIRLNDLSGLGVSGGAEPGAGAGAGAAAAVEEQQLPASPAPDRISTAGEEASAGGGGGAGTAEENLPYPTLAPVVFFYLKQSTRPRSWCLKMVCNPYPLFLPVACRSGVTWVAADPPAQGRKHLLLQLW